MISWGQHLIAIINASFHLWWAARHNKNQRRAYLHYGHYISAAAASQHFIKVTAEYGRQAEKIM